MWVKSWPNYRLLGFTPNHVLPLPFARSTCDNLSVETKQNHDRQLMRIIVCGLALAFGSVFASMESVRATPTGYTSKFTVRTVLTLLVGAAAMLPIFKVVFHSKRAGLRRAALTLVAALAVASFFYPIVFLSKGTAAELLTGFAAAAAALSFVAGFIWMAHRFLSADANRADVRRRDDDPS
jgi:hypothetical protein